MHRSQHQPPQPLLQPLQYCQRLQRFQHFFSRQLHSLCDLNLFSTITLASFFFAVFANIAFWRQVLTLLPWEGAKTGLLLLSFFLFIFCGIMALFLLLLWHPFIKPVLGLLLLTSASINYFCITYGVYIDRNMIQNVMRTDAYETAALLTPQLILWVVVFAGIPLCWLMKLKIRKPSSALKAVLHRAILLGVCMMVMLLSAMPLYKEYASFFRNHREVVKLINPTNYLHALYAYARQQLQSMQPLVPIGLDAQLVLPEQAQKPFLLVVVVGEASRAQNFSLIGYARDTNPLLAQQNNLFAFQNVTSCGTSTAVSVPCMFSNMPKAIYSASRAEYQENVLDIVQRAGVTVLWKENNTGCQGVCPRIPSVFIRDEQAGGCKEDYCYDEQLLSRLDRDLANSDGNNVLITLHTIGSHGPSYYRRYSKETITPFQPACETNQIQNCTQEQLTNVYDNTILHVDYFLNETIEFLKQYEDQYDVAMLYISDHGQSLGESGIYLHGLPYAIAPQEQTQIPMIFWASDTFLQTRHINASCMQAQAKNGAYSQDNMFHTLLGLTSVSTSEYQAGLDIFNACQN